MTLVIAEKPDLGKAIAAAIMPHRKLRQGYIEGDNMIVTWALVICSGSRHRMIMTPH